MINKELRFMVKDCIEDLKHTAIDKGHCVVIRTR